jgi:hypothetical protein
LIIDADAPSIQLAHRRLYEGFTIFTATSAEQAGPSITRQPSAVIVINQRMSVMMPEQPLEYVKLVSPKYRDMLILYRRVNHVAQPTDHLKEYVGEHAARLGEVGERHGQ